MCYPHLAGGGQDAANAPTSTGRLPQQTVILPTISGAEVEKPCMEARIRAVLLVEVQNLANNRDLVTETEFQNIQLIQS